VEKITLPTNQYQSQKDILSHRVASFASMSLDWESQKDQLRQLYLVEKKSVIEVIEFMSKECGFDAR